MTHTIMAGNPVDGVTLWGVFPTSEEANEWAEQQRWEDGWYCVPMMATAGDVVLRETAQSIVGRLKVFGVGSDDSINGAAAVDMLAGILEDLTLAVAS